MKWLFLFVSVLSWFVCVLTQFFLNVAVFHGVSIPMFIFVAVQELRSESEMCKALKAMLDSEMGPLNWHVIIGEQFGSFVTHESSKIIYIRFQKQLVLCWAHG